jgi:hypothetical protein
MDYILLDHAEKILEQSLRSDLHSAGQTQEGHLPMAQFDRNPEGHAVRKHSKEAGGRLKFRISSRRACVWSVHQYLTWMCRERRTFA